MLLLLPQWVIEHMLIPSSLCAADDIFRYKKIIGYVPQVRKGEGIRVKEVRLASQLPAAAFTAG